MSWEDEDWDAGPVQATKDTKAKPAAPAPEKSWDDEDKEPEPAPKPAAPAATQQPKLAAKAAGKASAKASAKPKAPAAPAEKLTPDEEKRRQQDEVLKSDVGNMKDIFSGVVDEKDSETEKKFTTFVPITEADFEEFAKMLNDRIQDSKGNHNYLKFLKFLLRQLTDQLKAEDVKQLGATLTTIQNERLAVEKAKDGPKGKKKGKAVAKKAEDFAEEDFVDDDLDAFM